ncbi:hypothetical protein BH11PLA1_BH11PLA1_08900 [soil metagenome]
MLDGMSNFGAMPALERTLSFAAARQRVIAHNIANVTTPNFRQIDMPVAEFQQSLKAALSDARDRQEVASAGAPVMLGSGAGAGLVDGDVVGGRGQSEAQELLTPRENGAPAGVLAHDRNNRSLESLMQDMVENAQVYRLATDLLRSRMDILRSAISERV